MQYTTIFLRVSLCHIIFLTFRDAYLASPRKDTVIVHGPRGPPDPRPSQTKTDKSSLLYAMSDDQLSDTHRIEAWYSLVYDYEHF